MNGDGNLDQVPKNNDTPKNINENSLQDQLITKSTRTYEVHHHPHVEKKNFKEYSA